MLIDALCLLHGDAVSWLPDSSVARPGLSSLLANSSWIGKWWLCLTDAFGSRQYAYVLRLDDGASEQAVHLCILSSERKPTAFFEVLEAISAEALHRPAGTCLRSLLRVLAGALPASGPGTSLRLELPTTSISMPPADADDALLWDGLLALGLSDALELWHALLFERSVLLLSDHSALLTAACDALLLLREPLRWEGTYVPYLPPSLLDAVEAPTPFLMGCGRTAFLAAASRLDAGPIFVADLDAGRLTRPGAVAGMGPPPPLPKDAGSFLEPLVPLLQAWRHPHLMGLRRSGSSSKLGLPSASDCMRTARRCFGGLLWHLLRPSALLGARAAPVVRPLRDSSLMQLDWATYLRELTDGMDAPAAAAAEAFAEELKSTLGFEGLVAALLRPLDGTFDEAQTLELPFGATPAPVATLVIRVLPGHPTEAAAAAAEAATAAEVEDRYAISLSFATDEAGVPAGGAGTTAAAAPPETLAEMPVAIGLAQARARASVAALQRCFDELRAGAGAAAAAAAAAPAAEGVRAVELMEKRRVVLAHRPLHTPPRPLHTPPRRLEEVMAAAQAAEEAVEVAEAVGAEDGGTPYRAYGDAPQSMRSPSRVATTEAIFGGVEGLRSRDPQVKAEAANRLWQVTTDDH